MKTSRPQLLCLCSSMLLLASGCDPAPPAQPHPAAVDEPAHVDTKPAAAAPAGVDADVAAAVNVVIDYYAAINEGDYQRAYRHWGQDGAASGKSFDEFSAGFGSTAKVEVTPGTPGRVDPAAGSRYISIPVVVNALTNAGEAQRFEGTYNLRRAVVDGATQAQRRWHFYSASLHATPPENAATSPQ